ncbi:MAG: branched-chain amino acid transport system substrate-binding protein, partial [Nocardioidaceae bacterium]|nr:branched-chain amino acid transport system substrate-binding protein [Nocardioidaceae bacterium]
MSHISMRRGWRPVALAGVIALSLAACGGNSSSTAGGSNGGGTLTIGASLPLTGDFSEPGGAAKQGYEVWANMVNASGGLLGDQVKLDIKDDASNQNTIVSDYNALISKDNVDLLLGTFSSLLNLPASSVAEKNRMLYVEPAGGSPDMFSRGYKMLFFAQQATADTQGLTFA